jgi:O-antigen/teichoic acid export membrane protein
MTAARRSLADSPYLRLSLNSFWLLGARFGGQALALLSTILIARRLGETGLGQYAFIAAVVFIGNTLSSFGLDTLLIREIATRAPSWEETISAALFIQLGLSAAFIAGTVVIAPRLSNQTPETLQAFRLATLALIPMAFSTITSAVLRASERMDLYMLFSVGTAGLATVGTALVLRFGYGLTGIAAAALFAQACGAVLAALLVRTRLPGLRWRWMVPRGEATRRALRIGLTLATLMVLAVFYQRLGTLMLSLLEGDAATGWYSAAARVVEALKTLPAAFFGALFPLASRAAGSPARGTFNPTYRKAFSGMLALALAGAAVAFFFAGPIIRLLYGPGYEPAVEMLRVLIWSLPATLFALKFSFDLVTHGRERLAAIALAVTLSLTALLLYVLINRFGPVGAAAAVVAGESFHAVLLWLLGRPRPGTAAVTEHASP